eukprot:TRINITY_DN2673_c1_g1_i1.p2 TRINITY_DN2673_c1_g1~~TRINITY_DN2673_c1_g1_i1.p2  ORF type:complete len:523 (-),score=201.66 TRINITY_DN2673_c1_g1_i1:2011-3579(-)
MAQNESLSMQVELAISCDSLPSFDLLSKSDPMVILYVRDNSTKKWTEVGRTEQIKNDSNPKFSKQIPLRYYFEEVQQLKFTVIDIDKGSADNVKSSDLIGKLKCNLAEIVGSTQFSKALYNKKKSSTHHNGTIQVKATEIAKALEGWEVRLIAKGRSLDKKDLFGKSDPYLIFERPDGSGGYTMILKTEVIKNTLDPMWNTITAPIARLAPSSVDSEIRISCYDWDAHGSHDFIGWTFTSVAQLRASKRLVVPLINPKKKEKKGDKYKDSGSLELDYSEFKSPTFLEYIMSGMEISLSIAIDYTGSNGNPDVPSSLHYQKTDQLNEYAKAIRSVGDVVAPYDRSGNFAAYGFGGSFQPAGTSHCFNLNLTNSPYLPGIDGVLMAYRESFKRVSLSGPTYFNQVLTEVNRVAASSPKGSKYHILLIITDGVINDQEATIKTLRLTANLPISVIIVGVGSANFDSMDQLDDDDGKLGLPRDCVQFVPFRDFINQPLEVLAKKTLVEVPPQLVKWAKMNNIYPRV